jgi:DNA gyrase subunit A
MFATEKGTVKKTALSAYASINRRGIIAIGLDEGDSLIEVALSSGKDHILLATKSGLAIRFEEGEVRAMGRTAGGVTGARFKREGDAVVSMVVIPNGSNDACCLLTACVNGYGKRSALAEYPVKGRGTRGVADIDTEGRNGDVVGVKLVGDTDEMMMITQNGILIRTRASDVRQVGRNTQGVRLIRIVDGDKLGAMARVEAEEPAETTPSDSAATPPEAPTGDAAP